MFAEDKSLSRERICEKTGLSDGTIKREIAFLKKGSGKTKKTSLKCQTHLRLVKYCQYRGFTTLDMKDYSVKDATSSLHVGTTSSFSPYISITPLMSPEKFFLMDNVPKSAVFAR